MASNGSDRGELLSAGGVLSIVAGISQIISGVLPLVILLFPVYLGYSRFEMLFLPFLPDAWRQIFMSELFAIPEIFMLILWCASVLGIVAIVGGISAVRRKRFGLSLAGAICALPSVILGILAVIFVALGKREFSAGRK
jgi:hypothetical protein